MFYGQLDRSEVKMKRKVVVFVISKGTALSLFQIFFEVVSVSSLCTEESPFEIYS